MKMKRNSKRLVALMAAMMICLTFHAKTQDVVGKVIDKNNNPVPFVNVVLLSLPDSAFVQGAVTDEQGMFKIVTSLHEGLLKLSSVGYETLFLNINTTNELTIQMMDDTQMLGEVVVKSQLPQTHAKGDAMRTTVAGTILEKAGTVSDALSKIPSLEAERDGAVKVLPRYISTAVGCRTTANYHDCAPTRYSMWMWYRIPVPAMLPRQKPWCVSR